MSRICAGIVTYNPSIIRLKESLQAICSQVEKVYIVDNGSNNTLEMKEAINSFSEIEVVYNEDNRGIATALNQMCSNAYIDNYDWILTLDQDTVCPENIIKDMLPFTQNSDLGIICPDVNYEGWTKKEKLNKPDTEYVYACMTSASLTRLVSWKKVGGFDDGYFIDFVDNEFCMKLSLSGFKVLRVFSCSINHQLGESREISLFGIYTIRYTKHNPIRFYYMSRNNYVFIKKYKKHLPVLKEYCKLMYILVKGWLFSDNKRETNKYILMGLRDGRHNKMGKLIIND